MRKREIYDPVLTFQLSNDFHVRKVMTNYLPNDEESKHYACLLQWDNIYYQPETSETLPAKTTVRVGLVQWQMRGYRTIDDLFEQIEFFVDAVSGYKSDFILFPEYFNAPLMAEFNNLSESQAIRGLAGYTDEIRDRFLQLAISYNINIITGSMPLQRDGNLYNVGFLCRRDGSYEMYEKIHVTPDETKSWGLSGEDVRYGLCQNRRVDLLRCGVPRTVAHYGRPRDANPLRTLSDGYAERLLARTGLRPGPCHRERVLCGDSR